MHTSKKGVLIIIICCTVIGASYIYYKRQHTNIPVAPQIEQQDRSSVSASTTTVSATTTQGQ